MANAEALPILTADACRAARAILRWSIADLVREAHVSPNSIQKIEQDEPVRPATADRIVRTFDENGIAVLPSGASRKV
ncbi:MAG TPA: hypothetical protein VF138_05075 [Caulobacteraceae bacterium]